MLDSHREQRPLLSEEFSDEESRPGREYRRSVGFRGRARNKARGAAAIIGNWPDHWSSSLTNWWIIFGMLILTILVIYNVALTVALLPISHNTIKVTDNTIIHKPKDEVKLPEVFMHIIVGLGEEIDVNKYLPAISQITDKHLGFHYKLIFVVNDTAAETVPYKTDELNNNVALDDIFNAKTFVYKQLTAVNNINVMEISLSDFMKCSSISERWRLIPSDFIPFVIRAISIWDNGGIAFNPLIIKPEYSVYIEKIHSLLRKYKKSDKEVTNPTTIKVNNKPNNIRDIIEALENNDNSIDHVQENLTEAESSLKLSRRLLSIDPSGGLDLTKDMQVIKPNFTKKNLRYRSHSENKIINNMFPKLNMLPLFLNIILNKKPRNDSKKPEVTTPVLVRKRKSPLSITNKTALISKPTEITDAMRPMIIETKINNDIQIDRKKIDYDDHNLSLNKSEKLTIDLKGNILAADVPCHAFIGNVLRNVFRKPEGENVTAFLIRELSLFCKGVLSRCKGVDVILL